MNLILNLTTQGLINGAIYALVAIGLAMVFGLLRVLHIAHAGLFTLGGYLGLVITNATGSFALGMVLSMVAVAACGMLMYRFCYEPILEQPPYVPLIASVGMFLAIEELLRLVFGDYGLSYRVPPLQGAVVLAGMQIKYAELGAVAMAVILLVGLAVFAARTRVGMAWRASVSEPRMAASCGISLRQVRYLNFAIGSAFAAAAGVMVGVLNNLVEPSMGAVPTYKALAIIVIGGLGNMGGTLVASLLLGLVEAFGSTYLANVLDRDSVAFAAMLAVLLVKPEGLFSGGHWRRRLVQLMKQKGATQWALMKRHS
ncbi:branched-chain amino acid ABC transporter permease [Variovorax sp. OV700]|jgi:branched-chain amino acid transport system permease protein|uniref:branched-chain amino acid ABC transporter permease n=1 Tax=Variovorax sp. OV700 TaxID=1882826 RepID=UPI0008917A99|nr:branched-chain amino acid ABC transporter permease [Variovorax sp. OV700]SDH78525.1 branched-chain amino acid transport system permease protein [Variovorax sp. OV700]